MYHQGCETVQQAVGSAVAIRQLAAGTVNRTDEDDDDDDDIPAGWTRYMTDAEADMWWWWWPDIIILSTSSASSSQHIITAGSVQSSPASRRRSVDLVLCLLVDITSTLHSSESFTVTWRSGCCCCWTVIISTDSLLLRSSLSWALTHTYTRTLQQDLHILQGSVVTVLRWCGWN